MSVATHPHSLREGSGPGAETLERLLSSVGRVIRGKDPIIEACAISLVAGGHVLLDDIPGVGKTTLARSLAKSVDASFQRIQFTADVLPGDVTGVSIWNEQTRQFEFRAGPIFHQIVLADELNRASPRTQSALLEAMNEGQVTVDGVSHPLPELFLVIATQNPQEHAGTFPLPESQLDRFLLSFEMGYPDPEAEREILSAGRSRKDVDAITPVLDANEVLELQQAADKVALEASLVDYLQRLVQETRRHDAIELGVSPRGALALRRAAQARAILRGRDYCTPDDLQALAPAVFVHRITLARRAGSLGPVREAARRLIPEILREVPVPA